MSSSSIATLIAAGLLAQAMAPDGHEAPPPLQATIAKSAVPAGTDLPGREVDARVARIAFKLAEAGTRGARLS